MDSLGRKAQALQDWFVAAVDRDTLAFNDVIAAMRLPRKTEAEIAQRTAAIEQANLGAALVPLEVLERSVTALELAHEAAQRGNPNSVSDAGVAGACAQAAARGASLNVRINLPGLAEVAQADIGSRHDAALAKAAELGVDLATTVDTILAANA
jgi:glutamate formiminotransferase/formiminotetrahydrofolate cyclodeaminase